MAVHVLGRMDTQETACQDVVPEEDTQKPSQMAQVVICQRQVCLRNTEACQGSRVLAYVCLQTVTVNPVQPLFGINRFSADARDV